MNRQSVLVLAVFVLVAAPGIAAVWTQVIPEYQARAEVQVRPIIPRLVFRTEDTGAIPFYAEFMNTQLSIMRSWQVLQRVLDQREVQQTQWYKNPRRSLLQRLRRDPTAPMERLRDALSAQPRRGTEIIDVAFMDPNAEDAKLILDTVLAEYMRYVGEKSDAIKDKLYDQLVEEYKSLEDEILGREKICADLRRSLRTGDPDQLISSQRIRLDGLQARFRDLRTIIAVLEKKEADANDSNDVAVAFTTGQPKYHEDAEWRERDVNVRTIQHNIATSQLEPSDPDMIRAKQDLKFAEELLRLREAQLDEQWRDRLKNAAGVGITTSSISDPDYREEPKSLEHRLAQAKHEEQLLVAEIEKQEAEFDRLFATAQSLQKENSELLHKRQFFEAVRRRLDQKNIERNAPRPIEILTSAFVPSQPHNDHRIVFTAVALVLGLSVGVGAAFLRPS